MSLDDLVIVVDAPDEIEVTVADLPVVDLSVVTETDVVVVAAGNVGPQGPPGELDVPGIADGEFPVWDVTTGTWIRSTAGLIQVASAGMVMQDVNLFRASAGWMMTDNHLIVGGQIHSPANGASARLVLLGEDPWTQKISTLVIGNTDYSYIMTANGQMVWGPGISGQPMDVSLYRLTVGVLHTPDSFNVGTALIVGGEVYDATGKWFIDSDGNHQWGPGTWVRDTNLYRLGVGALKTDGVFAVGGELAAYGNINMHSCYLYSGDFPIGWAALISRAAGDTDNRFTLSNDGHMYFGAGVSGVDVELYRNGVGSLFTNAKFAAAGYIVANANIAEQIALAADGRLYFGNANDTNLFRGSANQLRTDDDFVAGGNFTALGGVIALGADVSLYREAANILRTDDVFKVGTGLTFDSVLPGAYGGANLDWRSAGDVYVSAQGAGGKAVLRNITTGINGLELESDGDVKIAKALALGGQTPPTAGIKFADGTTQTTAAGSAAALVPATTLPGSPTNGQQAILTDSTTAPTWQWLCQYDSAISDTYKWRVLGPVSITAENTVDTATNGYTTIATLAAPRSGVYAVTGDIFSGNGAMDSTPRVLVAGSAVRTNTAAGAQYSRTKALSYKGRHTLTSGQTVDVQSQANGSDGTWSEGSVSLTPVRII